MIQMSEIETAAERRQREEREARTAEIRQMLEQPDGQEEAAKRFGKNILASTEYKAAQRQRKAAQAQRREAAETRAQETQHGAVRQKAQQPGRTPTRQEMLAAQKSFQQTGRAEELRQPRKQAQSQ